MQRLDTVIEFSNQHGTGGLLSLRETVNGGLLVDLYRLDAGVTVRGVLPAIRFIVDTYCQDPDRFGNSEKWARVTSTVTGRSLNVKHVGGARNIPGKVRDALGSQKRPGFDVWSWINSSEHDVPRKLFSPPKDGLFESELTADVILGLELQK